MRVLAIYLREKSIKQRKRIEDVYPLVDALLPKICKKVGTKIKRISAEALNMLTKYIWPVNVGELENVLGRVGRKLGCGTGFCASMVIGHLTNRLERQVW